VTELLFRSQPAVLIADASTRAFLVLLEKAVWPDFVREQKAAMGANGFFERSQPAGESVRLALSDQGCLKLLGNRMSPNLVEWNSLPCRDRIKTAAARTRKRQKGLIQGSEETDG